MAEVDFCKSLLYFLWLLCNTLVVSLLLYSPNRLSQYLENVSETYRDSVADSCTKLSEQLMMPLLVNGWGLRRGEA